MPWPNSVIAWPIYLHPLSDSPDQARLQALPQNVINPEHQSTGDVLETFYIPWPEKKKKARLSSGDEIFQKIVS